MTPLEIMFLIHCHVFPNPYPNMGAPAVQHAAEKFIRLDLINRVSEDSEVFKTTAKGKAHIKQLCDLPLPRLKFIDFKGEEIKI